MLDADRVRACFPALDTDWAFFDNAGGSAPARHVIERVAEHMRRLPFQLGASYPHSAAAREAVEAGRAAAGRLVHAPAGEIVFGASSTVLVQRLARALAPLWRPGDEVVVTNVDHEANIGPWRGLEERGIVVREWRFDPGSLALELGDLDGLLSERTRLVAFTHGSNVIGTVHDVRAIAERVRAAGALSCVDGVAVAPHRRIDVASLGTDFYFLSLYKVYGPHLAVLHGRRELLEAAHGQYLFFHGEDAVPVKLEPGNPCYELAAATPGIVEYLEELDRAHGGAGGLDGAFARIAVHEAELAAPLLAFLDGHPRARIVGLGAADPTRRVPTISFTVEGLSSSAVIAELDARRLAARFGHFYAYRLVRDLGLPTGEGVVRVSLVHYNTPDEVARLVAALTEILAA